MLPSLKIQITNPNVYEELLFGTGKEDDRYCDTKRGFEELRAMIPRPAVGINSRAANGGQDLIPPPKNSSEKEKSHEDFIMNNVAEITEGRANELLDILKKNSLKACQPFALKDDSNGKSNGEKEWKDLSGEDRVYLVMPTLEKSVEEAGELEALNLSRGLWVVELLVQPKWSNMLRNRRRNKFARLGKDTEENSSSS
ncbi:hypothetical protein PHYBLDRAFT_147429 [Phycomyces blakesleeanus NRRL 1555(-)]|uniref:Uncharacterized protein n=1 Tax=Phycomyces blakesleeanus (strain ATCC 8743b / DSM 1359 / FGSC 10004 / NBRC 33097 / NRRL 1555) TaxID=763407 RepID=A0A162WZ48_PHYB8|nr:hypothetical protein PHYBLDRAFT_147429 [Phycomyces blakesleeanus NRRL 1555(-)]OAD71675.1 hypothetical protein PHYBLDRAFT_147429 [Phycomyces blakesleeanus NRRL 1555(-)]|eukprot:XP_018289715.1 hypothetical protein PHYBLDRAFT_147429 [Phycomyces blakesleeanus NRRL 1555(-)]